MNGSNRVLGIVKNGKFLIFSKSENQNYSVRLTTIRMEVAEEPESSEIVLSPYEGSALLVCGDVTDTWIYSAQIIEEAGELVSALVQQLF